MDYVASKIERECKLRKLTISQTEMQILCTDGLRLTLLLVKGDEGSTFYQRVQMVLE